MKYEIIGTTVPYVQMNLDKGKAIYTQSGGMCWRDATFEVTTNTKGGLLSGLGRALSGDSIFMSTYTATSDNSQIAFAATVPGEVFEIKLGSGHPGIIAQKGSFLCAEDTVQLKTAFTKRLSTGLFSGEGFILQDIFGEGTVFLETAGNISKRELKAGESILIDTGNVVCFDKTCEYEIETVKGVKNALFGGEGIFLTKVTGPGVVVMQSQNFADFANKLIPYMPRGNN